MDAYCTTDCPPHPEERDEVRRFVYSILSSRICYANGRRSCSFGSHLSISKKASSSSYGGHPSVKKEQCDPFNEPGQLEVKQGDPDANVWRPWDPSCNASALLTDLRNREPMPWLHNKTVAIFGDSIDRDHIEYVSISITLDVAVLMLRSTCTTRTTNNG